MTKMAIYEKEYAEEDLKITSYYKKDYSSFNTWITLIWITAGYVLAGGLFLMCNADGILEGITILKLVILTAIAAGRIHCPDHFICHRGRQILQKEAHQSKAESKKVLQGSFPFRKDV